VVGKGIGISRQAARQRYRHLVAHQPETGPAPQALRAAVELTDRAILLAHQSAAAK
jgi:hypothetical protein